MASSRQRPVGQADDGHHDDRQPDEQDEACRATGRRRATPRARPRTSPRFPRDGDRGRRPAVAVRLRGGSASRSVSCYWRLSHVSHSRSRSSWRSGAAAWSAAAASPVSTTLLKASSRIGPRTEKNPGTNARVRACPARSRTTCRSSPPPPSQFPSQARGRVVAHQHPHGSCCPPLRSRRPAPSPRSGGMPWSERPTCPSTSMPRRAHRPFPRAAAPRRRQRPSPGVRPPPCCRRSPWPAGASRGDRSIRFPLPPVPLR